MLIVYCTITNFLAYVALKVRRDDFLVLHDIYEYCNVMIRKICLMLKPTTNMRRARSPVTVYISSDSESQTKPLVQPNQNHQYNITQTASHDACDGVVSVFTADDGIDDHA